MLTTFNHDKQLTNGMNWGGKNMSGAELVANIIAGVSNQAVTDPQDIALGMMQSGNITAQQGMSFLDNAAWIGLMSQKGIYKGQDAGTLIKVGLERLQPSTKPAQKIFNSLRYTDDQGNTQNWLDKNGRSIFYDQNGEIKDLATISTIVRKTFEQNHLAPDEMDRAFNTIGGTRGIRMFAQLYDQGANDGQAIKDFETNIKKQTLDQMFSNMQSTTGFDVSQFGTAMQITGVNLFTPLLTPLSNMFKVINNFLLDNQEKIQKAGNAIGKWFSDFGSTIANSPLVKNATTLGGKFKGALTVIGDSIKKWASDKGNQEKLKEWGQSLADGFKFIFDTFGAPILSALGNFLKGLMKDGFKAVGQELQAHGKEWLGDIGDAIIGALKGIWDSGGTGRMIEILFGAGFVTAGLTALTNAWDVWSRVLGTKKMNIQPPTWTPPSGPGGGTTPTGGSPKGGGPTLGQVAECGCCDCFKAASTEAAATVSNSVSTVATNTATTNALLGGIAGTLGTLAINGTATPKDSTDAGSYMSHLGNTLLDFVLISGLVNGGGALVQKLKGAGAVEEVIPKAVGAEETKLGSTTKTTTPKENGIPKSSTVTETKPSSKVVSLEEARQQKILQDAAKAKALEDANIEAKALRTGSFFGKLGKVGTFLGLGNPIVDLLLGGITAWDGQKAAGIAMNNLATSTQKDKDAMLQRTMAKNSMTADDYIKKYGTGSGQVMKAADPNADTPSNIMNQSWFTKMFTRAQYGHNPFTSFNDDLIVQQQLETYIKNKVGAYDPTPQHPLMMAPDAMAKQDAAMRQVLNGGLPVQKDGFTLQNTLQQYVNNITTSVQSSTTSATSGANVLGSQIGSAVAQRDQKVIQATQNAAAQAINSAPIPAISGGGGGIFGAIGQFIGTVTNVVGNVLGGGTPSHNAGGLWRVPTDGLHYIHKDEMILPRGAASNYRNNASSGEGGGVIVTGNTFNVRNEEDIDKIARALAREIQVSGGLMG
jgi:TP901 family phage tail tape measure protein